MIKSDDLAKLALTACVSIIITGAGAWLVFGQNKPTRSEVDGMIGSAMVLTESRINANAELTQELKGSVTELVKAQQALVVEQRVLIERVNTLVTHIDENR